MQFYAYYEKEALVGLNATNGAVSSSATPISKEEFLALGGTIHEESLTPTEELQKETNLLKAQLKAQTESSTFLEDCIAEMALQVYK